MKKTLFLAAAVICAAFLLASCDKLGGGNGNGNGNSNTTKSGGDSGNTTAGGGDSVGVPECDAYLKKYETCLNDKVPAQAKDTMKSSLNATRDSWKKLAANPQTKASLAAACKQADDQVKASMTAYGCSW